MYLKYVLGIKRQNKMEKLKNKDWEQEGRYKCNKEEIDVAVYCLFYLINICLGMKTRWQLLNDFV